MARNAYRSMAGIICLTLIVISALSTPSAHGAEATMTRNDTEVTARSFLGAMLNNGAPDRYCSESFTLIVVSSGQRVAGANAARLALYEIERNAQANDATIESLLVGEGVASAEIVLSRESDSGYPQRYSAYLTLEAGVVTEVRLYGITDQLELGGYDIIGSSWETLPAPGPH